MNQEQMALLQRITLSILETVAASGAPSGPMFGVCQAQGASLKQYQSIMQGLTSQTAGMLTVERACYHITSAGKVFIGKMQAKLGVLA